MKLHRFFALILVLLLTFASANAAEWTMDVDPAGIREELLIPASPLQPLADDYVPGELIRLSSRRVKDGVVTGFRLAASSVKISIAAEAEQDLTALIAEAERQGMELYIRQGARTLEEEQAIYQRYLDVGEKGALKPGCSDLRTGLAVFLVGKSWRTQALEAEAFAETPEARWLAVYAPLYGFVVRYPEGKQDITGNAWEPWHLRYVGREAARWMDRRGAALEEFLTAWQAAVEAYTADGSAMTDAVRADALPEGPLVLAGTDAAGDSEILLFHD